MCCQCVEVNSMAKYLIYLLLPVLLLCAAEESSSAQENIQTIFKMNQKTSLESELNGDHSRQKRAAEGKSYIFLDNRSGKTAKLYWRDTRKREEPSFYLNLAPRQSIPINTYSVHEWTVRDTSGRSLNINEKQKLTQNTNKESERAIYLITNPGQKETKLGDKYIEILVVMDKSAVDVHKNSEEAKKYVVTILRLATNVFQHKDITDHGLKLHLVLSKLVMLKRDISEVKLNPDLKEKNLFKVCRYMNEIGNTGTVKYDHKLFITKNSFGMGGFAQRNTMCSQYSSCSMIFDHGFTASFLIAHELAHSLGADDKPFGQNSGMVMSGMVDARFDFHRWSTHSQVELLGHIRTKTCLSNKPTTSETVPFVNKYPGVHFSLTKQCQFEYGKDYSIRTSYDKSYDPCKTLMCRMPPPRTYLAKTTKSPALDGTDCGNNKWCMSGRCVIKGVEKVEQAPIEPTEAPRVDGVWKKWGPWSKCSRTCDTGLQTRTRICELGRNGGRPCVGPGGQVKMCETGKTCRESVNEAVCTLVGRRSDFRRQWKFYDKATETLDCTFESGTCKWRMYTAPGFVKWLRQQGETPSSETGPSIDHTLKTPQGHYLYLESSLLKAKAILESPFIKTRKGCLTFWYHMRGDRQMGQLKVLKVKGAISTTLWRQSGNKGDRWYQQAINVEDSGSYKLRIFAKEKGNGYKSDIAIDDVTFTAGSCSSLRVPQTKATVDNPCKISCKTSDNRSPTKILSGANVFDGTKCRTASTNGVCYQGICKSLGCDNILITSGEQNKCVIAKGRKQSQTIVKQESRKSYIRVTTRRTTKIKSASRQVTRTERRLDCDFDRNSCQWNMKDSNWQRERRTGGGYYIRVKRANKREGGIKVASITSSQVPRGSGCLRFSYSFRRNQGGYASLRVKKSFEFGRGKYIHTKKYLTETGERWKEEKVQFQSTVPFKVVFEARIASTYTGLIAIDDVRFDPGKCPANKG